MNTFFQKYKKEFLIVVSVVALLLILFGVRVYFALNAVNIQSGQTEGENAVEKPDAALWQNDEAQHLQKEIYWLEQQLVLAKSDSISLGINLTDSVVQVQLKGTILFQSKIMDQRPKNFLPQLKEEPYLSFAKIHRIQTESANIPKKPIKKVQAPKDESEVTDVKQDTIPEAALDWDFRVESNINVVIKGVAMDEDSLFQLNTNKDVYRYQANGIFNQILPENYTPTLYIWLNDKEAKAIYRALPERGKVIFRN